MGRAKTNKKKEAFTIRLPPKTIKKIEEVAKILGLKPSVVGRNYLNLSEYIMVSANTQIQTYDKTPLASIPLYILKNIFGYLSEQQQFDIGDSLGVIINTNANLLEKRDIESKLKMINGLGWMEVRKLGSKWAFSAQEFPIAVVHALVYRMLHNRKYPQIWTRDYIQPHLNKTTDELKDIAKDNRKKDNNLKRIDQEIPKFDRELGGSIENYSEVCRYYSFNTLKINNDEEE